MADDATPSHVTGAPLFSVVVPAHDAARTITSAIRSILDQTGATFEVVVVDDGSTDDTAAVVEVMASAIVLLVRQANAGRSAARNAGAAAARGRYLTFLDSDDEALPGWLAGFAELLDPPAVPIARQPVSLVAAPAGPADPGVVQDVNDFAAGRLPPGGCCLPGSFALTRELFDAVGGYDATLDFSENTDLLIRVSLELRRRGGSCAAGGHVGARVRQGEGRRARYGSAPAIAARHLLDRYGAELDPRSRHDYHAIIGVDARRRGDRAAAVKAFAAAWLAHPRSWRAPLRLARALVR